MNNSRTRRRLIPATTIRKFHRQSLLAIVAAVVIGLWATACGSGASNVSADAGTASDAAVEPDAEPMCTGDVRSTQRIYFGTEQPTLVPLTSGQIMAVGSLPGCSGTLISPTWVLTAAHCGVGAGDEFCVGASPTAPDMCMKMVFTVNHDNLDITLGQLETDATRAVPGLEPIPIVSTALDDTWLGKKAEAAGYGGQEDGNDGEREFTAEPIVKLDADYVTIDGEGVRGACFGDSGGPVLVIAADNTVRLTGDLSWGAQDCLGEDNYARVDLAIEWVESFTGPTLVGDGPFPCGAISPEGRCMGGNTVAMYCGGGTDRQQLQRDSCSEGTACGWDSTALGYRCIADDDPCGGVDNFGRCDGAVARWCEAGTTKSRDCGSCGEICAVTASAGGASCAPDPCMGTDYLGRCDGDVAVWCQDGALESRDCAENGQTCAYVDDSTGYFCQ